MVTRYPPVCNEQARPKADEQVTIGHLNILDTYRRCTARIGHTEGNQVTESTKTGKNRPHIANFAAPNLKCQLN